MSGLAEPRLRWADWVVNLVFLATAVWYLVPVAIQIRLRLPAYIWSHEPLGVRFFEAWLPQYFHASGNYPTGSYPFVIVGWLLDLFHRGLLFLLLWLGLDPVRDFVGVMTTFATSSVAIQSGLMIVVAGIVARNLRVSPLARIAVLITGASLGYVWLMAPGELFIVDFPLTRRLFVYIALAYVVSRIATITSEAPPTLMTGRALISRSLPVGVLASLLLFLEPTLLPYAALALLFAVLDLRPKHSLIVAGLSVVTAAVGLCLLWLVLTGVGVVRASQSALMLLNLLRTTGPVEPLFRLSDFVTSGTLYSEQSIRALCWLVVPVAALIMPAERRFRVVPVAILFGLAFYVGVLVIRRPGNVVTEEILVYLAVTGIVCILLMNTWARRVFLVAWCLVLCLQTVHVAHTAFPIVVAGARANAEMAAQVDAYAKSFGLPILYAYRTTGPDSYNLFQSAESAAFKGVQSGQGVCSYGVCTAEERAELLALVVPGYEMVGEPKALPSGRFVLLFADIIGRTYISRDNAIVAGALKRASACRAWVSGGFGIHVCHIRPE